MKTAIKTIILLPTIYFFMPVLRLCPTWFCFFFGIIYGWFMINFLDIIYIVVRELFRIEKPLKQYQK